MRTLAKALLALALALVAPAAFAQQGAKPAPAPAAQPKTISLSFEGNLRSALKQIADKGGINLVITGKLDEPAEVYLKDVSAEDALATVAKAHHLSVTREGSIWTLRPMTEDELGAAKEAEQDAKEAADEQAQDAEEEARDQAEAAREQAQEAREQISKLRGRHGNSVSNTGPLTIDEDQTVEEAVTYGGPLTVNGHVRGDAVAFGGGVVLGPKSVVEGDVTSFGGSIQKAEGAVVGGDETAFGGSGMGPAMATVGSELAKHTHHDDSGHSFTVSSSAGFFLRFVLMFGIGFLSVMFLPSRVKSMESEIKSNPLRCGATGLVASLALVPLSVLLAITLVGIPVLLGLYVVIAVFIIIGYAAVATEIGLRLPLRNVRKTQAVVLALGLLILLLVGYIPVLGSVVLAFIGIVSLGAAVRTRFGSFKQGIPEPA